MNFEKWKEAGDELCVKHSAMQWEWGDWWNSLEPGKKHDEDGRSKHVQADDWAGPAYRSLCEYGKLARRFTVDSRMSSVSFKHHQVLASDPAAEALLQEAKERGWSAAQMKKVIAKRKAKVEGAPVQAFEKANGEDILREAMKRKAAQEAERHAAEAKKQEAAAPEENEAARKEIERERKQEEAEHLERWAELDRSTFKNYVYDLRQEFITDEAAFLARHDDLTWMEEGIEELETMLVELRKKFVERKPDLKVVK